MRLLPAVASVEVTGTLLVGLLLSDPADSVAAATPGGWLRTGRIGAAPGAPGDLAGLSDAGLSDAELSELLWRAGDEVARRLREG
jgi:hypothetical protein